MQIGYYSTNDKRNGKFRKVEVKMARSELNGSDKKKGITLKELIARMSESSNCGFA